MTPGDHCFSVQESRLTQSDLDVSGVSFRRVHVLLIHEDELRPQTARAPKLVHHVAGELFEIHSSVSQYTNLERSPHTPSAPPRES